MRRHNLNFVCALVSAGRTVHCRPALSGALNVTVAARPVSNVFATSGARRFYGQGSSGCWNCQEALSGDLCIQYTCLKCNSLLTIPQQCDYFQLFGLEKRFTVNLIELQRRFRAVQNVLHPDKFGNKSEKEQTLSADWSSLINNAYRTLHSPIRRGEYLLELHGVAIPEDNSELNKEFLMELMERNEEVDEASDANALTELLRKVRGDLAMCAEKLGQSLDGQNLDEAKTNLITFRYFVSLENSIKEKGNRLGIHLSAF